MMRQLIFPVVLLYACGLHGQHPGPCQPKLCDSDKVKALCNAALSTSGELVLYEGNGSYCTCTCEEVLSMTVAELNAARDKRDSIQAGNFMDHVLHFPPGKYPHHDNALVSVILDPDTVRVDVRDGHSLCEIDRKVLGIIERIRAMDKPVFEHLEFIIEMDITDHAFPRWGSNYGEDNVLKARIYIPRRLLADETAGEELITFLLLHEIGHLMIDPDEDSEASADEWASMEGLNDFHGGGMRSSSRMAFLNQVDAQLRAYMLSVFRDDMAYRPSPADPTLPYSSYPDLDCRTAVIRGQLLLDEGPTTHRYPNVCWQRPVDLAPSAKWTPSRTCRWDECGQLPSCTLPVWMCPTSKQVFDHLGSLYFLDLPIAPAKGTVRRSASSLKDDPKTRRALRSIERRAACLAKSAQRLERSMLVPTLP